MEAVRAAQEARLARLAPPPVVATWFPAREPEPEPEQEPGGGSEEEEESIFGLDLAPPPVVALPPSDMSHQLAMRARRSRQGATDAEHNTPAGIVTTQLSDPATTALLQELMRAAGIPLLQDCGPGSPGGSPIPQAAPQIFPQMGFALSPRQLSHASHEAQEAWTALAQEMERVLELAASEAEADTAREEARGHYETRQEMFEASREVLTDEERQTWEEELLRVRNFWSLFRFGLVCCCSRARPLCSRQGCAFSSRLAHRLDSFSAWNLPALRGAAAARRWCRAAAAAEWFIGAAAKCGEAEYAGERGERLCADYDAALQANWGAL